MELRRGQGAWQDWPKGREDDRMSVRVLSNDCYSVRFCYDFVSVSVSHLHHESDHIAASETVLFSCLIIRNFPSKVFIVHHWPLITPEGSREP